MTYYQMLRTGLACLTPSLQESLKVHGIDEVMFLFQEKSVMVQRLGKFCPLCLFKDRTRPCELTKGQCNSSEGVNLGLELSAFTLNASDRNRLVLTASRIIEVILAKHQQCLALLKNNLDSVLSEITRDSLEGTLAMYPALVKEFQLLIDQSEVKGV